MKRCHLGLVFVLLCWNLELLVTSHADHGDERNLFFARRMMSEGEDDPTEDRFLSDLFEDARADYDLLMSRRHLIRAPDDVTTQFIRKLSGREPGPYTPEECDQCVAIIEAFNLAVDSGIGFDDIRDAAVSLCEVVVLGRYGPRAVIMCPGLVDTHGPYFYGMFENNTIEGEDACLTMNGCHPEDLNETVPEIMHGFWPRRGQSQGERSTADYQQVELYPTAGDPPADAIKVAFLADIHIDHHYKEGSATDCGLPTCCREYWPGDGSAGRWGNYECNLPEPTLRAALRSVRSVSPDLLIYAGDNPPHSPWNETLQSQLDHSATVARVIAEELPGIPAFAAIGNHETYPTNMYKISLPPSAALNQAFFNQWQGPSRFTDIQRDSILNGGYYSVLVRPGLRVLSYHTNYAVTSNFFMILTVHSPEYTNMKNFMRTTLDNARRSGEKVILIVHHAMGSRSTLADFGEFLTNLCTDFSDVIVLHGYGHTHVDAFKVFRTENNEGRGVQFTVTSLSPRGNKNPTARIFYLDKTTFQLLEYDNYYIDMSEVRDEQTPELRMLYRASTEYGMPNLSPEAWHNLTYRFETDDELFQKYNQNLDSRNGLRGHCDEECKRRLICTIRHTSYYRRRRDENC